MWLKNERCGKYELFEKLASGGMADIFLGRTLLADGTCKFVAVKRIQSRFSNSQQFQNMFREEAKVAINLKNSNIVSTLDFGFENEQYYLVMDFVEGVTLRQFSNEMKQADKKFSLEQILYLVKEVAAGLDYVHRSTDAKTGKHLNLIHRDVSPHNIMVSFAGDVKIIDFGIAKINDNDQQKTESGHLNGKCRYMSPEQVEREELDERSDIFSLGIIMWELLANDKLFNDITKARILQKVKACEVTPIQLINPSVPTVLALIISRALSKDRDHRYQAAAELSSDLNKFLERKYPLFSKKDFSDFTKQIFQEKYAELNTKLSNIASIPYENPNRLVVLDDLSAELDSPPVPVEPQQLKIELPDGLGDIPPPTGAIAPNINFEKLLETNPLTDPTKTPAVEKNILAQRAQENSSQKIKAPISALLKPADVKYAITCLIIAICYIAFIKGTPAIRNYISNLRDSKKSENYEVSSRAPDIGKKVKVGYLNISLVKENPKVEILIDGKLLLEKPPLYMHPITAEKEITISAFDPVNKISAEVKVVIAEGKTKDVPLSFNPNKKK